MTTHRQQSKTALVFSAGGMFGAWQVGAWRVLEPLFQPDLIVGASIGAINAWAVAGGLSAAGLEEYWLTLDVAAKHRWRIPRSLLQGCADSTRIRGVLREIAERYPPQKHLAIVATELPNLRPHIFESPNVEWRHIAASIAIPGVFDLERIGNRVYGDGGLLDPCPVWAARALGATRILALHCLPSLPGRPLRSAAKVFGSYVRWRKPVIPASAAQDETQVVVLKPETPPGTVREAIYWHRDKMREWIDAGAAFAEQHKTQVSELTAVPR